MSLRIEWASSLSIWWLAISICPSGLTPRPRMLWPGNATLCTSRREEGSKIASLPPKESATSKRSRAGKQHLAARGKRQIDDRSDLRRGAQLDKREPPRPERGNRRFRAVRRDVDRRGIRAHRQPLHDAAPARRQYPESAAHAPPHRPPVIGWNPIAGTNPPVACQSCAPPRPHESSDPRPKHCRCRDSPHTATAHPPTAPAPPAAATAWPTPPPAAQPPMTSKTDCPKTRRRESASYL